MAALFNSSYVILEKNDQPYSDRTRAKKLATAINMQNNMDIHVAKHYMLDNYFDDWLGAININYGECSSRALPSHASEHRSQKRRIQPPYLGIQHKSKTWRWQK